MKNMIIILVGIALVFASLFLIINNYCNIYECCMIVLIDIICMLSVCLYKGFNF